MWKKAEIFPKKSHYFVNIELYTAQIFPLLPQQLLQWFLSCFPQQQLQLHFEGGGTEGSFEALSQSGGFIFESLSQSGGFSPTSLRGRWDRGKLLADGLRGPASRKQTSALAPQPIRRLRIPQPIGRPLSPRKTDSMDDFRPTSMANAEMKEK